MGSAPGKLGGTDLYKIGKGALIAAAGSLLAYVGTQVLPGLEGTSLGWLAPLGAIVVNVAAKWLSDTR